MAFKIEGEARVAYENRPGVKPVNPPDNGELKVQQADALLVTRKADGSPRFTDLRPMDEQILSGPLAQALAGIIGREGPPGPQGPVGPAGARGLQGEQGVQGVTGAQGERGLQGATGPRGEQGFQGLQGVAGPTGPQGERGLQGEQGATGPQGAQGVKGDQGAGVTIKGSRTSPAALPTTGNALGDLYIMSTSGSGYADGDGYAYTGSGTDAGPGSNWKNVGPVRGPQGPQGPQGMQGATGPKGDTGAIGATGPKGDAGSTGATGATGPKGDTGAVGAQGPQGLQGQQGIQGSPGATGPQGNPTTVNGKSGASITLAASDIGLGNVNNTSDAAKPVSTAQQAALNAKPNKSGDTYTGRHLIPLGAQAVPNGDLTQRIEGGVWQSNLASKSLGWPEDFGWAHLIASTQSDTSRNSSLQICSSIVDDGKLYWRKTATNGMAPWRQIWHDGNFNLGNAVFAPAYPTLQAALNAVPDGGILYLGAKKWVITQALTIANKSFRIQGAGVGVSVINYRGTDGYGIRISQDSYYRRFSLAGFTLTTNQDRTGVGIDVERPEGVSSVEYGPNFDDIEICGEDQSGPHAWGICMHLRYCWNTILNRCAFQGRNGYFSGVGLFLSGQSTPVQMYACRGYYLDMFVKGVEGPKNFEGFIANDCQVVACRHGIWMPNGQAFPLVQIHGGHYNVSGYGVRVSGRPQGSIKNVCFYHWFPATAPGGASPNTEDWYGVSVEQGADDFSVTGCHFYGHRGSSGSGVLTGIQWQGSADGQISDNAFIDLKVAVSAVDSPVMLTNNRARNCVSFMPNVPPGSLVKDNLRMSTPLNGSYRYPEAVPA